MHVPGAVGHQAHGVGGNACHRTAPARVDGCHHVRAVIIEQYGDAVGCLDAHTQAGTVGEDSVCVLGAASLAHPQDVARVCLSGQCKFLGMQPQILYTASASGGEGRYPLWGGVDDGTTHPRTRSPPGRRCPL